MTCFQFSLLSALLVLSRSLTEENTTLLLVQALFRHGDRAPTSLYPTDPNSEDSWPNGLGELTQLGKKQHYEVGKFLRSMYKDFVTTNPNEIYVNSSAENRCLDSAAANLASFYAPIERWKLEDDLKWQPIPIHYLPADIDIYFDDLSSCPRADAAFLRQINSKEIQQLYHTHQTLVEVVTNCSGLNYTELGTPFTLLDTLEIEKIHNLIIPEWAEFFWNEMSYISSVVFQTFYSSPIQLRSRAGPFLELISNNLMNIINRNTPDLKVVMSSSHDVDVAAVLLALNFTNMPRPPYCATLLFELHEMADASLTVRLLYLNSTDPLVDMGKPHVLVLDDCSEFCPVEYFINSFQSLIPDNWEEECQLDVSDIDGD